MTTRTTPWPTGLPCWADLTTNDMDATRTFYSAVLGWNYAGASAEYGGYDVAQVDGKAVAGIGPVQGDSPPAWTLYFATDDIDKHAVRITEAGGMILLPADSVGTLGKLLIAADPTGGVFGLWQAGDHIGCERVNEPGAITWEDLRSTDPDASFTFFSSVFDYSYAEIPMEGDTYKTFSLPGESWPSGGMGGLMGATDSPSHWVVYFGVSDIATTVTAAKQNGGTILVEPYDTPYGAMCAVADPFGTSFMLVQIAADNTFPERN